MVILYLQHRGFDLVFIGTAYAVSGCSTLAAEIPTGYLGRPSVEIQVEQGYEMGRPSQLHLRADRANDDIGIQVGGGVVPVARGTLCEPR